MELTWHGWSCFRLKGKEAIIVTDPYGPSGFTSLSKLSPDIITVSDRSVPAPDGPFRVVHGPGEYEVKNVLITGHPAFLQGRRVGAFYKIEMDELVICHLGQLKEPLTASQVEDLSDVDLLLIPVAGEGASIDAAKAVEVINLLEPRMVVPMHFQMGPDGLAGSVAEKFCHEIGQTVAPQPRLAVTKTSLPAEPAVVVLEAR
ncbi:MAG: MBL fold metallo-hydrolase [Chloroflexota bacterium]|nr:MBL fold metallo-hydrolase [Chloroflexota bacterium]